MSGLLFALAMQGSAQYKVRFIVSENCPIRQTNIFLSGTFNNWDSLADPRYKLSDYGAGQRSIQLSLPAGKHLYKYTGGNWQSVEKSATSNERWDRELIVTKDTVVRDTVMHWRNLFLKNMHWSINNAPDDTTRLAALATLANAYSFNSDFFNMDSTLHYVKHTLRQLQTIKSSSELKNWKGYNDWLVYIQEINAVHLHALGNYPKSLELRLDNLKLVEQKKSPIETFSVTIGLVEDYLSMKDYKTALRYCKKMGEAFAQISKSHPAYYSAYAGCYYRTAFTYYKLDLLDSAHYFAAALYKKSSETEYVLFGKPHSSNLLGNIYLQRSVTDSAFYYFRTGAAEALKVPLMPVYFRALEGLAKLHKQLGRVDSALYYARTAIGVIHTNQVELQVWGEDANTYLADISPLLAELYKSNGQLDSAYKYLKLSVDVKDKINNITKEREFQNISFNESLRQQEGEYLLRESERKYQSRMRLVIMGIILGAVLLLVIILYRNNKQKQKANTLLGEQKKDLEKTLAELVTTQKQLIHSEKMASLGELTAGIAHEIQNPLNFVNNFSEVNNELLEELKSEKSRPIHERNESSELALINDIAANLEKITHHGKRADAIVKGMLQHSRTSSGQKEDTDINALTDEYLRLAYHGLRAKDKSFNATIESKYDESIGKIRIIPQDIGRVILNLITNAFYAVNERKNQKTENYEPLVRVSTKKHNARIEIAVTDNGNGIPQHHLDKIFQPFFTTKPAGRGTGLGLSLSYDIVRAHGGELKVKTKEGEGSEFIIQIPNSIHS